MAWIVTGVLLVLLAVMPIRIMIGYSMQAVSLRLRIGFLTFSILPHKTKANKKKKDKETNQSDKPVTTHTKQGKNKQKTGVKEYLPILRIVLDLLLRLRSKLVMKQLKFVLILSGDDPCDLAVLYGRTQAAAAVLFGQIESAFHIKKRDIRIECDFTAEKTLLDGFADISIGFGKLLYLAVKYGIMILREYLTILKNKKAVQ